MKKRILAKQQQDQSKRKIITLPDGQRVYEDLHEKALKEQAQMIENIKNSTDED